MGRQFVAVVCGVHCIGLIDRIVCQMRIELNRLTFGSGEDDIRLRDVGVAHGRHVIVAEPNADVAKIRSRRTAGRLIANVRERETMP